MLKLHYHPLSTFSRRVHMVLLEKELPFDLVVVDMAAGAHRSPEYKALNPYGRVPTLVEDDFVLYESAAILEYLEATHPTPALSPADARGRARMAMHMKLSDLEMGTATGTLIFPKRFLPKEKWDTAAMEKARKSIQRHLDILEGQLGESGWLLGDAYTLADVCYTPFVQFFDLMDLNVPPKVLGWSKRLLARPSAEKTRPPM